MNFKKHLSVVPWVLLLTPITALSYAFYFVLPKNLPEIAPHYGESADGLQLGLSLRTEVPGDPASIAAYMTLRNTGTDSILIGPDSLVFFDFAASSPTGKKRYWWTRPIHASPAEPMSSTRMTIHSLPELRLPSARTCPGCSLSLRPAATFSWCRPK